MVRQQQLSVQIPALIKVDQQVGQGGAQGRGRGAGFQGPGLLGRWREGQGFGPMQGEGQGFGVQIGRASCRERV